MDRDDGFAIADVATDLYADPKVKALARRLRDPVQTAAHLALYEALRLGSWGEGQRITLEEAAPAWWVESTDDIAGNLQAVGLIDVDTRIPETSWARWFTPAFDRRQARRESGAKGGRTGGKGRPKQPPSDAQATPNPSGRQAGPSVTPSVVPPPNPPPSGGPRANGTNPRAVAGAAQDEADRFERGRGWRRSQRQMAAYRGAITEQQRIEMDELDVALDKIPGWEEHQARLRDESRPTVETLR